MLQILYRTDSPRQPEGEWQRLSWKATPPSHVREHVEKSDQPDQPSLWWPPPLGRCFCISSSSNSLFSSWNGAELDDDFVLETSLLLLFDLLIKVKSTPCGGRTSRTRRKEAIQVLKNFVDASFESRKAKDAEVLTFAKQSTHEPGQIKPQQMGLERKSFSNTASWLSRSGVRLSEALSDRTSGRRSIKSRKLPRHG